jgi:cell division protein FtsL
MKEELSAFRGYLSNLLDKKISDIGNLINLLYILVFILAILAVVTTTLFWRMLHSSANRKIERKQTVQKESKEAPHAYKNRKNSYFLFS